MTTTSTFGGITIAQVIAAASALARVDIVKPIKTAEVNRWRNAAYAAAQNLTGRDPSALGRAFKRHHASVRNGIPLADPALVEKIEKRVKAGRK